MRASFGDLGSSSDRITIPVDLSNAARESAQARRHWHGAQPHEAALFCVEGARRTGPDRRARSRSPVPSRVERLVPTGGGHGSDRSPPGHRALPVAWSVPPLLELAALVNATMALEDRRSERWTVLLERVRWCPQKVGHFRRAGRRIAADDVLPDDGGLPVRIHVRVSREQPGGGDRLLAVLVGLELA